MERSQDRYPFGPRSMVVVSWYLDGWISSATYGLAEGNTDHLLRDLRGMFDPEIGGLGFEVLSASSFYDWEIGIAYSAMGIPEFDNGSRFVVEVEDLQLLPFPVRIFSPREWQGLIHWGLSYRYRDDQASLALVHKTESQVFDLDGLSDFINARIAGEVEWEYGYPFDNPTMMARLREIHPRFPYEKATLTTDRNEL